MCFSRKQKCTVTKDRDFDKYIVRVEISVNVGKNKEILPKMSEFFALKALKI